MQLPPGHPTAQFRPDLEGLRAVAVLLVLLYHAGMPGFPGGYVGVDVFFVLSGFLITGLIYRELRGTGEFSLSQFYARRARRLLPAAFVVLLFTLAASVLLIPSFRLPSVSTDIASAGLYVSNMRFGVQANDYFQATAAPSPVLHFWSLSVEEQFYIFWPTILLFFYGWFPGIYSRRNRVAAGIIVLGVTSLLAGIWLTGLNQPWAFFLLPTRAWELAVGGLIAVRARQLIAIPKQAATVATAIGVLLVIVADLLFSDSTPFPGIAAVVPVTGAALVIIGGLRDRTTVPSRLLSVPPMRFLGRISYSIYLWHWPILVFGTMILGNSMSLPLALAAIPVAAASQRWVEEPFRRGRLIGDIPRVNLLQAGGMAMAILIASLAAAPSLIGTAAVALAGTSATPSPRTERPTLIATSVPTSTARPSAGTSGRPPSIPPTATTTPPAALPTLAAPVPCGDCSIGNLVPQLGDLASGEIPTCEPDSKLTDPAACVYGNPASGTVVVVFGDSHAESWLPAFIDLAVQRGWRLVALTHGGCPSLVATVWAPTLNRAFTECDDWRQSALDRLEAEHPSVVVLANTSQYGLVESSGELIPEAESREPTSRWSAVWTSGLEAMLSSVTPSPSVVVIGDVPTPSRATLDPPTCIAQHPSDFQVCEADPKLAVPYGVHTIEQSVATANGATFVDPTPWLCAAGSCPAVIGQFVVYQDDSGHMTPPFAESLASGLASAIPFPQ